MGQLCNDTMCYYLFFHGKGVRKYTNTKLSENILHIHRHELLEKNKCIPTTELTCGDIV